MAGLVLGGISFSGFEIPNRINFGGAHNVHVHELIGGNRVLDAMGSKPDQITWNGIFRGPSAIARAQAVDELRIAGSQIDLAWLNLFRSVVVINFKANTEKAYEVPYSISCEVVGESAASLGGAVQSLDGLIASDLQAIAGFATSSASSAALGALATSLANIGPIVGAPNVTKVAATLASDTASVALQVISAKEEAVLGQTVPNDLAINVAAWLSNQATIADNHSTTLDVLAYVKRIGLNLNPTPAPR